VSGDTTSLGVDYIVRAVQLRRAGRIPIVLVEGGKYWLAEDPADPWGSKKAITHEALRRMIDAIDGRAA